MSTTPVSATVQTSELRVGDMVHGGHEHTCGDWATVQEIIRGRTELGKGDLYLVTVEQRHRDGPRRYSTAAPAGAEWVRLTF